MSRGVLSWLPNAVGFQLVWCSAVGGAARGWWWAGPLALLVFAFLQLALSHCRRADVSLLLFAAIGGFAIDTLWVQLGWIEFSSPLPWATAAPLWIVSMWMGFALTLNHSLAVLKAHPVIAVVFGLIGGPLAYWVASSVWGAAIIAPGIWPYVGLAVSWGIVTPLLLSLAVRLCGPAPELVTT